MGAHGEAAPPPEEDGMQKAFGMLKVREKMGYIFLQKRLPRRFTFFTRKHPLDSLQGNRKISLAE